mgnify:CR=1 FL=1
MKLEFKKYISRFTCGLTTSCRDNGYGTGAITAHILQYRIEETF